jgi:N-acetylglucosaminyldiphosphoundecaprenol N-acetyl-beta-D-mannosaminyltransferase
LWALGIMQRDASLSLVDAHDGSTSGSNATIPDDLSRDVFCIMGIPVDAVDMPTVLGRLESSAASKTPFLLSTPNLHFLISSLTNVDFRESLLASDLCPADGTPIIWIARALGLPISGRIAGSDIFEAFKTRPGSGQPMKIFFFGATEYVAAAAARALNDEKHRISCVGWACPGFGSLEETSAQKYIDQINESGADFLVVALGAVKGQAWIVCNRDRIRLPIRSHLGATINFQAGTVKRSPRIFQRLGCEWLWRIGQEPHLWKRYWHDGIALLGLGLGSVLPLAIAAHMPDWRSGQQRHNLDIEIEQNNDRVTLHLKGFARSAQVQTAIPAFRSALSAGKEIRVNLSQTRDIDARFLGLILMLRKQIKMRGARVEFAGVPRNMARTFRLHKVGYLLEGS